tara:strand:+ start:707 stop:1198 length:492 start_codon:yes stop_codon:yes gene_type:complete
MSQFNVHKWKNSQLLKEAGLLNENQVSQVAKAIDGAISSIDDSLSYKVLASAVAQILKDEYGSHNFGPFMEVLKGELSMEESLNEASKTDFSDEFKEKFDVKAFVDDNKVEIIQRGDIDDDMFEEMIKFIEGKGYTVDRKQSEKTYDYDPGERDFYPRIKFSK